MNMPTEPMWVVQGRPGGPCEFIMDDKWGTMFRRAAEADDAAIDERRRRYSLTFRMRTDCANRWLMVSRADINAVTAEADDKDNESGARNWAVEEIVSDSK